MLCLLFCGTISAQDVEKKACEKVEVAGIEVLCFEQGIGAFSARERARAVGQRIKALALDTDFDPESLKIQKHADFFDIVSESEVVTSLSSEDMVGKSAEERPAFVEDVLKLMKSSILAERTLTSPSRILKGIASLVIATALLALLFFLMSKGYRKLYAMIQNGQGRYIRSLKIQSIELLNSNQIVAVILWLARASRVIISVLLFYIYLPLVLSFFPWTANFTPKLLNYILDPLKTISKLVLDFIPNLFFIFVIIAVTRYFLKFIKLIFVEIERDNLKLSGFYREWADPTYKLVRVLIFAFALVMAFPYLPGSSSPAFQGISVFLGLLISLGSSSAIANVVAGIVITYMRPFRIGDRVQIADSTGDVIEKNLLVTRIRSIKNVEITVPNSMVLGSHIINFSSKAELEGLVLTTTITIGYDVPWRKVHELLKDAANRTNLILKDKTPYVLQTALNDFYVAYELNAYTRSPNQMAVIYSELHQNIQDCFNEANVEIMSPHYRAVRSGEDSTVTTSPLLSDLQPEQK